MRQVVAALIVREGKILICQRTPLQTMPLRWEFPGGKVEPGEQYRDALRRELEEELGILAQIGPEITTISHKYTHGNPVELHFYLVEQYEGEIQNLIFNEVRWVTLVDLPPYDFLEADVALVRDLADGKISLASTVEARKPEPL